MPGPNQLPAGAEGAAAVVLTYSSISWICSALMAWLTWVHHERLSYVAIIAYWSLLSTTASITQQIHDITWWRDIMIEQFSRTANFADNPEIAIASGSYGMDLVLYYIQYYTYNLEAMCVMFWAFELAQSLYGWDANPRWRTKLRRINKTGKFISMLLPLTTILLLRAPVIQHSFVVFIILADLPLMLSLTIGSITMVAILCRYIRSRKKFSDWTPPNATSNTSATGESAPSPSSIQTGPKSTRSKQQGIYDRWLMVRFTCAFVVLGTFDITNTLFQLTATNNNKKDVNSDTADLSLGRANSVLFLFMPGVTPGVFLFIIFGTTAGHRKMMYETLIPRRWQRTPGQRKKLFVWPWIWPRAWRRVSEEPAEFPSRPLTSLSNALTVNTKSREALNMKPLPPRPKPSLTSVFSPRMGTSSWHAKMEDDIFDRNASFSMRDLEAARDSHGRYYEANPDQSDDSIGLPIMRPSNRFSK
ncbi:hypothetical protein F4778DRAFT_477973 [Xylariomycetidae sp. FL2044]|nr:hypothetical protein F4778DRAFT_477973 [Xylariomycetidae sp. FL2044]